MFGSLERTVCFLIAPAFWHTFIISVLQYECMELHDKYNFTAKEKRKLQELDKLFTRDILSRANLWCKLEVASED